MSLNPIVRSAKLPILLFWKLLSPPVNSPALLPTLNRSGMITEVLPTFMFLDLLSLTLLPRINLVENDPNVLSNVTKRSEEILASQLEASPTLPAMGEFLALHT